VRADHMSAVEDIRLEMSGKLRHLAEPVSPGESVKACLRRASIRAGIAFGQCRRLWYGEWRVVPAHVADQIRKASDAHDRTLKANMLRAVAAMSESDAEFFGPQIEELRRLADLVGNGPHQNGNQD